MLRIIIEGDEFYDEEKQEFFNVGDVVIDLEHSLVSLSKWESKYQKSFLSGGEKTADELFGYIKAMVIDPEFDLDVLDRLTDKTIDRIREYMDSPQSATTFRNMPKSSGPTETITSELIYYWMVASNVPFECQTWHLNRLLSLIRICNVKNTPAKKMSRNELAQRNAQLNAERKAQLGTTG